MLRGKCIKDRWFEEKNNDTNDTNSNTLDFVLIVMYLFYCFAAEFAHIIQKGVFKSTAPKETNDSVLYSIIEIVLLCAIKRRLFVLCLRFLHFTCVHQLRSVSSMSTPHVLSYHWRVK